MSASQDLVLKKLEDELDPYLETPTFIDPDTFLPYKVFYVNHQKFIFDIEAYTDADTEEKIEFLRIMLTSIKDAKWAGGAEICTSPSPPAPPRSEGDRLMDFFKRSHS